MADYSVDMQKLYIEFMLDNAELYTRVSNIMQKEFFDPTLRTTVEFINEHVNDYGAMPTHQQVKAKTEVDVRPLDSKDPKYADWFIDEFETFCKHKALEAAILQSYDRLEKKEYGSVEKLIKEAVQLGLARDMGTDYWANPADRLSSIKENNGQTSTGWKTFDDKLYGGFNKGELNIFAGGSGAGKSLFLQNLAINWCKMGFNTVYVSLELSEGLTSMRLDAMNTGKSTKQLFKDLDDVDLQVRMMGKKAGKLQIIQLPNGCTVNDLRSYIKAYEAESGIRVDAVLLDYLDLMMPVSVKVSAENLFIKDKYVSEELRNFAMESQYLFATASQLNRGAVDEIEFDHSHISGGLSKVQTADNVIGIFSSRAMRERGRVQIQFMKTRSSSAVGTKLDLAFDIDSLRIEDLDEQETEEQSAQTIYDKLKNKSNTVDVVNTTVEKAVDSQDRLRSLLKKMD